MNEEQQEQLTELIHLDEKLFTGFLLLKGLVEINSKRKARQDLQFIYDNYAYLLAERKNTLELKKKLESLNGFYGLR